MEVDIQQKSEEIVYRAGTIHGPSFDVRDRSIDKVWLVKDPKLYFPLNQDIPQSTRGQERKSLENVCLWETDTDNFSEHFILKEKFDGVFQVELKDSTNANCTLKEEKIQEIQRCLKSFKWRRTTVPPCKGGFPLIEGSALAQAVIVYMKDHYPITPEELNYHAELKAASHWSWSDDYTQLSMKKVPFDDCRLKIAAIEALKTWKKMEVELQSTRGNKIKGKFDKKLSDVRKAIDVLKKYTVQGERPTGGDTKEDMERNSERRTSPPKSRGKNHLVPNGMRFGEFQQLLKVAVRKDAMAPALRANCIEEHPSAAGTKSLQNGSPKKRKHEANSDGTVLAKRIKPAQRRISPRLQQTVPVNV